MKDGGPAFPQPCTDQGYVANTPYDMAGGGMSLRDYFAAKAMQGIISILHGGLRPVDLSKMAGDAYQIADAMIVARDVE